MRHNTQMFGCVVRLCQGFTGDSPNSWDLSASSHPSERLGLLSLVFFFLNGKPCSAAASTDHLTLFCLLLLRRDGSMPRGTCDVAQQHSHVSKKRRGVREVHSIQNIIFSCCFNYYIHAGYHTLCNVKVLYAWDVQRN